MQRKPKHTSKLFAFLEPYLVTGNQEVIAAARKTYSKQYKANWRKNQRKENISFTVSYTPSEAKRLAEWAMRHERSRTAFIKASSLSYGSLTFIVPDVLAVAEIRQLLTMCFTQIQALAEDNIIRFNTARNMLDKIEELEQKVLVAIQYPKTVEQWIQDSLVNDPKVKESILRILKNSEQ